MNGKEQIGIVKKIIGVTGGVGAGKSSVLNILEKEFHACVIIADEVGRKLMEPGQTCYDRIVETFGREMVLDDGRLDREQLSQLVFQDKKQLEALNAIVHPAVKAEIKRLTAESESRLIVIEAALLIEEGYRELCDELWYVYVPAQERIKRLYENRGYSEVKSYAIISNQLSDTQFRQNCDFLLDNSRSIEATRSQIEKRLAESGIQAS